MRLRRALAALATCALVAGCKRAPAVVDTSDVAAVVDAGPIAAATTDAGTTAPARCTLSPGAWTLTDVGDRRSLVVGDAALTADGFAVGLVHAPASGAEALVVRVSGGKVTEEWAVAKGTELVADAPPPRPLVAGTALYAVYVARGARDAGATTTRRIVLKKDGAPAPLASYVERADESLAFDAVVSTDGARAALVWDDDAAGITVASLALTGDKAPAPRVVSGENDDVNSPRLAPRAGGWWAAWIAHRPEERPDASAHAPAVALAETAAEERVYSWLEVALLGDDGTPAGAPRRLTSSTGHVASFDLAPRPSGELDVVSRDETQAREGEGGRVLHVVVRPDGAAGDPTTLVGSGAGRGSVDLLAGAPGASPAWLSLSDAQDRVLVLPLTAAVTPAGLPSVEDALEGGRFLAATSASAPATLVAAFPAAEGALFREVTCQR